MTTNNPFDLGAGWLHNDTTTNQNDGGDDLGDDVVLGKTNHLDGYNDDGTIKSNDTNVTTVANIADRNAAFAGINQSGDVGAVGVYGESHGSAGSMGVAGAAEYWGVAGVATAYPVDVLDSSGNNDASYVPKTGVFGAGDNFGVYGQCRVVDHQRPSKLHPPARVGVFGIGDMAGVVGENDRTGPGAEAVGTGVHGASVKGVGVLGRGAGDITQNPPIAPYIGVCGTAQTEPTTPYPVDNDYLATGVLGIGDRYGGVFQSTPVTFEPAGDDPYANIQLSPMALESVPPKLTVEEYSPNSLAQIQQLASKGQPGDIVAVQTTDGFDRQSVELWICIRPATATGGRPLGATWARIHYDNVVTMPTS